MLTLSGFVFHLSRCMPGIVKEMLRNSTSTAPHQTERDGSFWKQNELAIRHHINVSRINQEKSFALTQQNQCTQDLHTKFIDMLQFVIAGLSQEAELRLAM